MQHFALIGSGFMGNVHAASLARHPAVSFDLVADIDEERAGASADKYGARAISVDSVFESDVDAVLIASSTDTHADLMERAAGAGQAIYCEKPIDLDLEAEVRRNRYRNGRQFRDSRLIGQPHITATGSSVAIAIDVDRCSHCMTGRQDDPPSSQKSLRDNQQCQRR